MSEIDESAAVVELTKVHDELKVLALTLSSVRVIDPHELSKELNDHISKIRPFLERSQELFDKQPELLEDINHLAHTCLKMAVLREGLEKK
ncbi:hypothetical protein FT663_05237 [Candidozyma haemuli var. vulneris]|nr:hypothetical protein FT663_05237 [[Candida] haemuloni var. vulneris]KAF3988516.1 hypothetical protein FT662_03385 [[Candida] haemuloni var. vulneris]